MHICNFSYACFVLLFDVTPNNGASTNPFSALLGSGKMCSDTPPFARLQRMPHPWFPTKLGIQFSHIGFCFLRQEQYKNNFQREKLRKFCYRDHDMLICHAINSLRLASCGLPPLTHDGTSQHKGEYTKELTILLWHWEEGEGRSLY